MYPYISEGKKYTCSTRMLKQDFVITSDSDLLPEGEENATVVNLGIQKKTNSKITETFYKLPNGSIEIGNICEAIESNEKIESGKAIKCMLFEHFMCSQDCLNDLRLIRTTDLGPISTLKISQ